nr:SIR2 family protein [Motilibacter deserti]
MLRALCTSIEGSLSFDELRQATGNDYLQIAEYLYLKCDRHIGPIRHQLERSLSSHISPLVSDPHLELANLGAPQIYTTNYDDLIEETYRRLALPVSVVVLPKHVALAHTDRTQIVKYHGDLQHEQTLVLTESAYYKRLDFESPMDLKFRSDLLGKSVLFMGYSFRDVNIRIVWFKLMEMMRDIPEADRRPSYIVRLESNAALEELYSAVGLKTVVLSPDGPVKDRADRARLLADFLLELSTRAGTRASGGQVIASGALLRAVETQIQETERIFSPFLGEPRLGGAGILGARDKYVGKLLSAVIPEPHVSATHQALEKAMPYLGMDDFVSIARRIPASRTLTENVVRMLAAGGHEEARSTKRRLVHSLSDWSKIWSCPVGSKTADFVLRAFAKEITYQSQQGADEDIAYLADLVARISQGDLVDGSKVDALRGEAAELLGIARLVYPSIGDLQPARDAPPQLSSVLQEVSQRATAFAPVELPRAALDSLRMKELRLNIDGREGVRARPQPAPRRRPSVARPS